MEKVTKSVRIAPGLWLQARAKALGENLTMEQLIEKLLTEYLKRKGVK